MTCWCICLENFCKDLSKYTNFSVLVQKSCIAQNFSFKCLVECMLNFHYADFSHFDVLI